MQFPLFLFCKKKNYILVQLNPNCGKSVSSTTYMYIVQHRNKNVVKKRKDGIQDPSPCTSELSILAGFTSHCPTTTSAAAFGRPRSDVKTSGRPRSDFNSLGRPWP